MRPQPPPASSSPLPSPSSPLPSPSSPSSPSAPPPPPPPPPTVSIDPTTTVGYTTAQVSGTINPNDHGTFYWWQSSTDGVTWSGANDFSNYLEAGTGSQPVSKELSGLQAGTEYQVRLVATNFIDPEVMSDPPNPAFTTEPVDVPSVSIGPVGSITDDTAHFSGTINTNFSATSPAGLNGVDWRFECTPACPDSGSGTIAADAIDHPISGDAAGLDPNTDYEVRLVAANAGPPRSAEAAFKTTAVPPIVLAPQPPALLTDTSAWLGAKVNPQNSPTAYYVQYSTDPGFAGSTSVPATQDASAGSGNEPVLARQLVKVLTPHTTYHYRVIATGAGTTTGPSRSFTTRALPLPLLGGRVYEKVSPNDKAGADVDRAAVGEAFHTVAAAAPNGDAVAYSAIGGAFDGEGASVSSEYLARRNSEGKWTTQGLAPRTEVAPEFLTTASPFWWMSDDLSIGIVNARASLNPGDAGGEVTNVYLRDNESNTYQSVTNDLPEHRRLDLLYFNAASPDGSTVVFERRQEVGIHFETPDPAFHQHLYAWIDGTLEEVGVLTDGSSIEASIASTSFGDLGQEVPAANAVSDDGKRIYFQAPRFGGTLYLRDFGQTPPLTTEVSSGRLESVTADGSVAFFSSGSLYRWDYSAPAGERLTELTTSDPEGAGVLGTVAATDDGKAVYFVATGKLTPGAVRDIPNLYLWREGEGVRLVASLDPSGGAVGPWDDVDVWTDSIRRDSSEGVYRDARMSPDGRYLLFTSHASLTSYDTAETRQVYRYDSASDELICISCGSVEDHSGADSQLRLAAEVFIGQNVDDLPRNMTADGSQVVFDSIDGLVPEDSNGVADVYVWQDGKLSLISTGDDPQPSMLFDVSEDGSDIFFTTGEQLVPSDQDALVDLYDARIGGKAEPVAELPCVGDECQGTPTPLPNFATPSSANFKGAGNTKPDATRKHCAKGKVRRKSRCVAPKRGNGRKAGQSEKGGNR